MRFYKPAHGEQRIIRKFAWYPICINGIVYWLEYITIRQQYNRYFGWYNKLVEKYEV